MVSAREAAAREFFAGIYETDLSSQELLVAVEMPIARKGATHFFTEHLDQLRGTVDDYLTRVLPAPARGRTKAAAK